LNCFGNSSFGIEWSSEQSITDSKLESNSTTETNSIESKAETSESKAMLWVLIAILLIVLSVIAVVAIFAIKREFKRKNYFLKFLAKSLISGKKFTKSDNKNEETDEIHDELSDTKSMVGSRKSDHKTSEFQSKLKRVRSNESVRTVRSEL
jgi:flagellar biosynthesis/type III secretory pathway M-ring protein FliF/YscJ